MRPVDGAHPDLFLWFAQVEQDRGARRDQILIPRRGRALGPFDKFDQDTARGFRMHEGHPVATGTHPRTVADDSDPVPPHPLEHLVQVVHLERQVMQTLAALGDVSCDRRRLPRGFQQFDPGTVHR